MATDVPQPAAPPDGSSRGFMTVASLMLVALGSLLLPVIALLWAAAWTDFWGERQESATQAATFSLLALALLVLGVMGLRTVGRGKWAAPMIVSGVLMGAWVFQRWVGSE